MKQQNNFVLAAVTALVAAFVLFALAGYQVTSETAASRLLVRYSAALVEIDRWLPEHLADIELAARDRPNGTVEVRDLPIPVTLPASAISGAGETEVRARVLDVMAGLLYEHGNGAFRDAEGARSRPGYNEAAYWTALLLTRGAHSFWTATLGIGVLILLAFGASVLQSGRSLPAVVAAGAGFALVASVAVWLLAGAATNGFSSPLDGEVALIVRDGAWIGARNAFAVLAAASGLLVLMRSLEGERSELRATGSWLAPATRGRGVGQDSTAVPPDAPSR